MAPWRHDRVVEAAVVVMGTDGRTQAEYDTLINPHRDIGPTRIHQIAAADVIHAPDFGEVAGDLLSVIRGCDVIAGHNISFDLNFLIMEFERIGAVFPRVTTLCTCQLFGRHSLSSCCSELGLEIEGPLHCALTDARATGGLVNSWLQDELSRLESFMLHDVDWPDVPARGTTPYRRADAKIHKHQPPQFIQRIARQMRHDVEAEEPAILVYLTLIDRVLEDRVIDNDEDDALVQAARHLNLSMAQLDTAHREYLRGLAVHALEDGIVTDSERRDLLRVASLLGQDQETIDRELDIAKAQLDSILQRAASRHAPEELTGKSVCFTGQLLSTIDGVPLSRQVAQSLARDAGFKVANSVTKKLDLLVVADPDTQSTKARTARRYGTRILADSVFWRLAGVPVD